MLLHKAGAPADRPGGRLSPGEFADVNDYFSLNWIQAAPLFGYLGDRYSRKLLVIVGIILWASFSLASSFMPSYLPYLFVRALLSIGWMDFVLIKPILSLI